MYKRFFCKNLNNQFIGLIHDVVRYVFKNFSRNPVFVDGGRVEQSAQVLQELLRVFLGFLLLDRGVEPTRVESRGGAVTELVGSGGEILTRTGSTKIELSECSQYSPKSQLKT